MYGLYQIVLFTIIDILNTIKSPFFIAVLLIIYFQYYKISNIEKNNIGYKGSPMINLIVSALFGILGGIITTVVFLYLGVVIIPLDFIYILIVTIILSLINPRFMCFSYGGAVVSLFSLTVGYPNIQISQVMSVVAVLHIIESILIILDGWRSKLPILLETQAGLIGGFNMNRFWPIPFVIFIGDGLIHPITFMAIISYGDYSVSSYPRRKILKTSFSLFLYSIILLYIAKTAENLFLPPLFALLGHEFIILQNARMENKSTPIFTAPARGLKILEVIPNSICKEIGMGSGDILLKINGVEIKTMGDTEDIMEIENNKLNIEYFSLKSGLSMKRYRGKKKNLGIITVPRDF